jgi:hypothetical protein
MASSPTGILCRRLGAGAAIVLMMAGTLAAQTPPDRGQVLAAMKRATTFMVEKVSTHGGYVWSYLPDMSRRWGEMEAKPSMIWIQPMGTTSMGHLFLDAYHATGDEYYYAAASSVAKALTAAQHPAGGWHYFHDFAGAESRRAWYNTIGKNAWRLEEFQHDWGNATFDDGGTSDATTFLLRMYLEKHDATFKPALDKAVGFILNSQYPNGAWPQRFPKAPPFIHHGKPDYTALYTFNDDVAKGNIDVLTMVYQTLGGERILDAATRGMHAFIVMQGPAAQPGWALQYTLDGKPAGARTYEPAGYATHTTGSNIENMIEFYRLTGDPQFLARIPEALDWLDTVKLPAGSGGNFRSHPTFIEAGTGKPLYIHRRGSNIVNGEYYVDGNPANTVAHYGSFRFVDVARLRKDYEEAKAIPPADVAKDSPLRATSGTIGLPKYFQVREPRGFGGPGPRNMPMPSLDERVARAIGGLNEQGYWPSDLGSTSHPYKGDGPATPAPGDFSQTQVGDDSDTSPYRSEQRVSGISTFAYIRQMSDLIRYLDQVKK